MNIPKKLLVLFVGPLAALTLVGGGCFLFPDQVDYRSPDVYVEPGVPGTQDDLPVITVSSADGDFAGVQGSYCYGTTCVDKILPIQLIAEAELGYAEISTRQFIIRTSGPAQAVSVSVFDEQNQLLDCEGSVARVSDTEFTYDLCHEISGEVILAVFMTDGVGDMTYLFPIKAPLSTIISEADGLKTLESERFTLAVPADLQVEAVDSRVRIQNYVATDDGYILQDGEYFIEIYFGGDLTEEVFRGQYGTQTDLVFADLVVVRGDDRIAGGETETGGYGYFAAFVDGNVAIHVYSPNQAGEDAATAILDGWEWASETESLR